MMCVEFNNHIAKKEIKLKNNTLYICAYSHTLWKNLVTDKMNNNEIKIIN